VTGRPAEAKARATRSFNAWCLPVLPGDLSFTDETVCPICRDQSATLALVGDAKT